MDTDGFLLATLVVLPSLALVVWARLVMAQVEEELQSVSGLDVQAGFRRMDTNGPWP